ncbi:MAG: hypothetical protein FWE11_02280 [Defluviitaleaceae bacterium]|nr:hypothetical protein [Defluviitaleaceae bacterium]
MVKTGLVTLLIILVALLLVGCGDTPAEILPTVEADILITNHSAKTDFDQQLALLHEFARNLNYGGVELTDLRVTRVWGHPGRTLETYDIRTGTSMQVSFDMAFFNKEDMHNEELIAELFAFTGIAEDDISIAAWPGIVPFRYYDFLLVNQAMYEFAKPYLLLREFAMNINSDTTHYHEITITSISDHAQFNCLISDRQRNTRFEVGLSTTEHVNDQDLRVEILDFTGLSSSEVSFLQRSVGSAYIESDFLRENAELAELYRQWNRLQEFWDIVQVRTARRGLVIDHVITSIGPPSRGIAPFTLNDGTVLDPSVFSITFSRQSHLEDDNLLAQLMDFTGISRDAINFNEGIFYHGGHAALSPTEREHQISMNEFMDRVNAPFLEDRSSDPVIVRWMGPWDWFNWNNSFIIYLYDMAQTTIRREDVAAAIGVNPRMIYFELAEW